MKDVYRLFLAVLLLLALPAGAATVLTANLDGPGEAPPNTSPGTGTTRVTYDEGAHTMRVEANFSGLDGTSTAAHIHCCTAAAGSGAAGVATMTPYFTGFPLKVNAGKYDQTFDMTQASSYNPAFITNNGGTPSSAEATLVAGLLAGKAYLNIHSTSVPGGEIRGFPRQAGGK